MLNTKRLTVNIHVKKYYRIVSLLSKLSNFTEIIKGNNHLHYMYMIKKFALLIPQFSRNILGTM